MPGAYARLGTHGPGRGAERLDLHASTFDVDERAIGHGVRVLATTAIEFLARAGFPATSEAADARHG